MSTVAIFDLDGTLINVDERLKRCVEESNGVKSRFWDCFLSDKYMHLDKPNIDVVEYVRKLKKDGCRIVIVTGRKRDRQLDATLRQLKEFGIPFDEVYMREPNDFRKDYEFKSEIIKKLIEAGYTVVEVWDDSEGVISALANLLKNAKLVHYKQKSTSK